MLGYIKAHWRGELSLGRSYWINGVLLSVLINIISVALNEWIEQLNLHDMILSGILFIVLIAAVATWQVVGIWRSATNSSITYISSIWPGLAKAAAALSFFAGSINAATMLTDLASIGVALRDPHFREFVIERRGETDLIFTGAINEISSREIMEALQDPTIEILRVNSHGGLIEPAVTLDHFIRKSEIMVMAEGQCASACTLLLAASPHAAIVPDVTITFHRPEPVAHFTNPELRMHNEIALQKMYSAYRELDIREWAIDMVRNQRYWSPTLKQQIEMNLIVFIYDYNDRTFVFAEDYCNIHPNQCLR